MDVHKMFHCDAFWDPVLSPLSRTVWHDPFWKHPGAHVARFAPYSGSEVLFTAVIRADVFCSSQTADALLCVVSLVWGKLIFTTLGGGSVAVSPPSWRWLTSAKDSSSGVMCCLIKHELWWTVLLMVSHIFGGIESIAICQCLTVGFVRRHIQHNKISSLKSHQPAWIQFWRNRFWIVNIRSFRLAFKAMR